MEIDSFCHNLLSVSGEKFIFDVAGVFEMKFEVREFQELKLWGEGKNL